MATIEKRGNSYRVSVSDGFNSEGKRLIRRKSFKRPDDEYTNKQWEKEINRLALDFEREVEKGLQTQDQNQTLDEFVKVWLKDYAANNLEETTIDSYSAELKNKILPALGNIKLNKIQPIRIQRFLNSLLEDGCRLDGKPGPYSNRIIEYQWQILSSILQTAVYWQILGENPCTRVKPPKSKRDNQNYTNEDILHYDENQTLLLLDIIDDEIANFRKERDKYKEGSNAWLNLNQNNPTKYKVGILLALFCGLRNGEVLGLTWDDVDFENKTIAINKSRARTSKGMITKIPKNRNSIRTLSIPDALIETLKEYKQIQDTDRITCGDQWEHQWEQYPWIMVQWNGRGMEYSTLSKWLKKAVTRYNDSIMKDDNIHKKFKKDYLLPVLSFHKLRHTSATLLIGENTDIRTVAARLGHSKTSTTMDIYSHSLKSKDTIASDTLGHLLEKKERKLRVVK